MRMYICDVQGFAGFLYLVRNLCGAGKGESARLYNILEPARVFRGLKTKNGKYGVKEHDYKQSRQETTTNGIGDTSPEIREVGRIVNLLEP